MNDAEVPAVPLTGPKAAADRALRWLLGVLGGGISVSLISTFLTDPSTVGPTLARVLRVAPTLVLVIVMMVTMPGGLLSRDRFGGTNAARIVAVLVAVVYVLSSILLTRDGPWWWMLVSIACLWLSASLLSWRGLRQLNNLGYVMLGMAVLFVSPACLLSGIAVLGEGNVVSAVIAMLGSVMALVSVLTILGLAGVNLETLLYVGRFFERVAMSLLVVVILLVGVDLFLNGLMLPGVISMMMGTEYLVFVVRSLGKAKTLLIVVLLLAGALVLLVGVGFVVKGVATMGALLLLLSAEILFTGIGLLLADVTLLDVVLAAPAMFFADSVVQKGWSLLGVTFLLLGVVDLFLAVMCSVEGDVLLVMAFLLTGLSSVAAGIGHLCYSGVISRLRAGLSDLRGWLLRE